MRELRTRRNVIIGGGLSLLIIVSVIAGLFWYNHMVSSLSNHQSVIVVRELGIQMTVPDSINDLKYQVSTIPLENNKLAIIASFSTSTLLARNDPGCSLDSWPIGTLSRVLGQYPSDDPYASMNYGTLVKQFSTFYIAAGTPQGACTSDPTTQGIASEDRIEFQKAERSIRQLN